jgi:aquaporin Z
MNPARTLGSAIPGNVFTSLWIYLVAPPLAMLLAAQVRLAMCSREQLARCAKLVHASEKRCIFCGYKM